MNPKISIVIPVYNGADYLQQAIDSALNQTSHDFEVIVVNDGSNDDGKTEAIAKSYGNRIRYFSKPNGGVSSALNVGIQNMRGEWFTWLSHDDLFSTNRIESDFDLIRKSPEAKVIFCKTQIIDSSGAPIRELPCLFERITNPREALMMGGVDMCSMTIHRSCFDTVDLFNESNRTTQDTEMSLRLSSKFPFYFNVCALTSRRDHLSRGTRVLTEQHQKDVLLIAEFMHRELTLDDWFPNLPDDERQIISAWRWLGYEYEWRGAKQYAEECYRAAMLARKNPWRRYAGLIEFAIRRHDDPFLNTLLSLVGWMYQWQGIVRCELKNHFIHRTAEELPKL